MWLPAIASMPAVNRVIAHAAGAPAPGQLDRLALFGFMSGLLTIQCFPFVRRSRRAKLVFAASLTANSVYGFLSGAWPLGMVAIVVTGMAIYSWWLDGRPLRYLPINSSGGVSAPRGALIAGESRVARLFGPSSDARRAPGNN